MDGYISGDNHQVSQTGETAQIFGAYGEKRTEGDTTRWYVNLRGGRELYPIKPTTLEPALTACLQQARLSMKRPDFDALDTLYLNPSQVVILFLEGRLTAAHFEDVTEHAKYFTLRDALEIDGRSFTVFVDSFPAGKVGVSAGEQSMTTVSGDPNDEEHHYGW